jgi:hypothetical protein
MPRKFFLWEPKTQLNFFPFPALLPLRPWTTEEGKDGGLRIRVEEPGKLLCNDFTPVTKIKNKI